MNYSKRFRYLAWVIGCFLIVAMILEVGSRIRNGYSRGSDRYYHPYLMIGGFRPGGFFESKSELDPKEIPEAYGYRKSGLLGTYIFDDSTPVQSITDRGKFLYRDRAALADAKDGAPKIFILGGSVAYGEGASYRERRWYVTLEKILKRKFNRQVHVIPAANHSYVSTQERIVMDLFVLPKHPDIVIDVTGFNDANTESSGTRPGDPYGQSVMYNRYESPLYGFIMELAKYSTFVQNSMTNEINSATQQNAALNTASRSVADVLLDNVAQMQRRCDLERISCFFFLQPARVLSRLYRPAGWPGVLRKKPICSPEKLDAPFCQKPRGDDRILLNYAEILRQMKEKHSALRDLTHVFDDSSPLPYLDSAHFNDAGHDTIAQAIADQVEAAVQRHFRP